MTAVSAPGDGINADNWVDGTKTNSDSPVTVTGLNSVIAIAAGVYSSIALKKDGEVWQWGDDITGPARVAGLTGVTAIAGGKWHTMALKSDGTVWAWGNE